jgi:hypothetical protein
MAFAAIHALLSSQNRPQIDLRAQSLPLGDAPNARLLQTSLRPPASAAPTSMLHTSGLLDQLAVDGSMDNARLAALIRAAAELYSIHQGNASSAMASFSSTQSAITSQAPARSEYTQATQVSTAMPYHGQVANGNLVQAQQQVSS